MIKELHVSNFKKFKNEKFEFSPNNSTILIGGNNSGKSSILQALAIWEFCKMYLEFEKGKHALLSSFKGAGIGIGVEDFSPINIPALNYLWTNLKSSSGYNLKIKCTWDAENKVNCFLEFGLALANDRLFVKATSTNLLLEDKIPVIAYLPPFAGISDRESWVSVADRRRLVGRGLAGAVLRNTLIEMHNDYWHQKAALKGGRKRISKKDNVDLKNNSSIETLNRVLEEVFSCRIEPEHFNPSFHNYIRVNFLKGKLENGKFKKFPNFTKRDIMVEGSGFLQWLSVFTYVLKNDIDILLLDEPDAHLHTSLQIDLLQKLISISKELKKQIFITSHSAELIKNTPSKYIYKLAPNKKGYLSSDIDKIGVLAGLGTEYSPKINTLQKTKRMLIVENESDVNFLKIFAEKLGKEWIDKYVVWNWASKNDERKHLVLQLKDEINNIVAISLVDRDNNDYSITNQDLSIRGYPDLTGNGFSLHYRMWRRRHIESYLISPNAISKAADTTEEIIRDFLQQEYSITIPNTYAQSHLTGQTQVLFDTRSKEIMTRIEEKFGVNKFEVAKNFDVSDICEDIITFIDDLITKNT